MATKLNGIRILLKTDMFDAQKNKNNIEELKFDDFRAFDNYYTRTFGFNTGYMDLTLEVYTESEIVKSNDDDANPQQEKVIQKDCQRVRFEHSKSFYAFYKNLKNWYSK